MVHPSCGTALTTEHIDRLRAITQAPIWFCFDSDTAGQRAMLHAWNITANQGRSRQQVIQLPAGQDPASIHLRTLASALADPVPMCVAVADTQLAHWGRPDTPVKAALMVSTLAERDCARIHPDDVTQWILTVSTRTDVPVTDVQTKEQ